LGQPAVAGVRRNEVFAGEAVRLATEIFEEHGGFIRAVIRFQARRAEEEDLFQEFFLALIRNPVPAGVQNLRSYLYRAVTNHVVDSARRRENYRRALKKYAKHTRVSINKRPAGNALIVDDTEEKNAKIAFFARHLQEREAQAFVLRHRDNRSIQEIAAMMGVNARTVSRYLSEGIRKLRQALATQ
jgi:RNA polymerase sigma factor (sigma-70 family)